MIRVTLLILIVCLPSAQADDEKDIRKVLDDQNIAWNKGDLEGFMRGYWKSKDLTFVSGKDITRGWDETLERYKKRYQADGKEMGKLTFSDVEVKMLAPGVSLVTGKWELKLAKETVGGRYSLIVRKLDEGWKINSRSYEWMNRETNPTPTHSRSPTRLLRFEDRCKCLSDKDKLSVAPR